MTNTADWIAEQLHGYLSYGDLQEAEPFNPTGDVRGVFESRMREAGWVKPIDWELVALAIAEAGTVVASYWIAFATESQAPTDERQMAFSAAITAGIMCSRTALAVL